MVSTDPRTRLLTVRLSEEEYARVKSICRERRIRTISEFTRIAVAHEITAAPAANAPGCGMAHLDLSMERLNSVVERLVRALEMAASGVSGRSHAAWGTEP